MLNDCDLKVPPIIALLTANGRFNLSTLLLRSRNDLLLAALQFFAINNDDFVQSGEMRRGKEY